jgi:uracil-DNA glycosylase
MKIDISGTWGEVLAPEFEKPYFAKLSEFVDKERAEHEVYPTEQDVFNSFRLSAYEDTRVLLLGQDPYHDTGQAHGLCFSVRPGITPPPSLRNIFIERKSDVGLPIAKTGYLAPWASQGILMLNAVLTVRAHEANSHKGKGWEKFTDHVLKVLSDRPTPMVFILWGGYAQKKKELIDAGRHMIIESAHPSPLSARNGFFGSKPFSRINEALRGFGTHEIDWRLPGDG